MNWASLSGVGLILAWLFAVPVSAMQVWFLLNRRADPTPAIVRSALLKGAFGLLRLVGMPLVGASLFFQAWRIDAYLQFVVAILTVGWIAEITASAVADYSAMRSRDKS
jgi:hypothetical protein